MDWETSRREYLQKIQSFAIENKDIAESAYQLIIHGPVWAGDLISKSAKARLIDGGFCVAVVVKGEDGYYAANYRCRDLVKVYEEMKVWPFPL